MEEAHRAQSRMRAGSAVRRLYRCRPMRHGPRPRTPEDDRLIWLHCSDFHVGKDRTAQERLLGKIVEHVQERVATGCVPDLVFITGDLANRDVSRE